MKEPLETTFTGNSGLLQEFQEKWESKSTGKNY